MSGHALPGRAFIGGLLVALVTACPAENGNHQDPSESLPLKAEDFGRWTSEPSHDWSLRPLSGGGFGPRLAVGADGNIFLVGSFAQGINFGGWQLFAHHGVDAFVVKLSRDGGHRWSRGLGGPDDELVEGVAVDSRGDVFVLLVHERAESLETSERELGTGALIKLSKDGVFLWEHPISVDHELGLAGPVVDGSGRCLVAGAVENEPKRRPQVLRFASEGEVEAKVALPRELHKVMGIAVFEEGQVAVLGNGFVPQKRDPSSRRPRARSLRTPTMPSVWVATFGPDLAERRVLSVPPPNGGPSFGHGVAFFEDGDLFVAAAEFDPEAELHRPYVARLNSSRGSPKWSKTIANVRFPGLRRLVISGGLDPLVFGTFHQPHEPDGVESEPDAAPSEDGPEEATQDPSEDGELSDPLDEPPFIDPEALERQLDASEDAPPPQPSWNLFLADVTNGGDVRSVRFVGGEIGSHEGEAIVSTSADRFVIAGSFIRSIDLGGGDLRAPRAIFVAQLRRTRPDPR